MVDWTARREWLDVAIEVAKVLLHSHDHMRDQPETAKHLVIRTVLITEALLREADNRYVIASPADSQFSTTGSKEDVK